MPKNSLASLRPLKTRLAFGDLRSGSQFQSYLILGSHIENKKILVTLAEKLKFSASTNSPDTFVLEPRKISTQKALNISIEQIRNLKKQIFQRPVASRYRAAIIYEAEKLTQEAQNAFLKILEEPPEHAIIVLLAENEFQLLPTILSRVVKLTGNPNTISSSENFLTNDIKFNLKDAETIENPKRFLDKQITSLYGELTGAIKEENRAKQLTLQQAIIACVNAKTMISANINPRFVLANLFLGTQS